jgi:hypothetical protein
MNIDKPDVGPDQFEYHDGKGPEKEFDIKQWYWTFNYFIFWFNKFLKYLFLKFKVGFSSTSRY